MRSGQRGHPSRGCTPLAWVGGHGCTHLAWLRTPCTAAHTSHGCTNLAWAGGTRLHTPRARLHAPSAQLHTPCTAAHAAWAAVPWDVAEPGAEGGPAAGRAPRQRCHEYWQGHVYSRLQAHSSRWWCQRGMEARLGHGLGEHYPAGEQELGTRDPAWPAGVTSRFVGPCRRVSQLAMARHHPPLWGPRPHQPRWRRELGPAWL